jgi:hypothetical protein
MTLLDVLRAAAEADGPAVVESTVGDVAEWSVDGRPFAAVGPGEAAFRLDPLIGRAALGTPDTGPSARGGEWIAFRPATLDRFAIDRAQAWFASARRHTAGRPN